MLATPEVAHYAERTKSSWDRYCRRHGYGFYVTDRKLVHDMHINWTKIEMMRRHLRRSEADWVVLVDADTHVVRQEVTLENIANRYPGKTLLFAWDGVRRFGMPLAVNRRGRRLCGVRNVPNAGFIVVRNSPLGRTFFDDWLSLARGRYRHLADIHPRNQNVLWAGLFAQYRECIAVLGGKVARIGTSRILDAISLNRDDAFVLHDKRLHQQRPADLSD